MAGEGKVVPVVTRELSAVIPKLGEWLGGTSYDFCPEQQIAQDPSVKDKDSPEGQEGIIRHAFLWEVLHPPKWS